MVSTYPKGVSASGSGVSGEATAAALRSVSEAALAKDIERMFALGGWQWFHPFTGKRANTILDYMAWRERLIHIELKTERGRLTRDRIIDGHFVKGQERVITELREAGQEVYVLRPRDIDFALALLVLSPRRAVVHQERLAGQSGVIHP